jgi:transglutaminase-like putative cysteine protease
MANLRRLALLWLAVGLFTGCVSSRGDDDDASDDDDDTSDDDDDVSVEIEVDWPLLEMVEGWNGGDLVFPTSLAHLMGQDVSTSWWSGDFALVLIENTGSNTISVEVTAELTGYSVEDTDLITLGPGESEWVDMNPTSTLSSLYALSSEVTGQALVEVRTTGGKLLAQETESVRIATKRDWFQGLNGQYSWNSVATMVRKNATEVIDALDDAVEYSWFDGSIGVGGYRADAPNGPPLWPEQTPSVPAGGYASWSLFLEEGREVTFGASSDGANTWLYVMSSAEFSNLQAGSEEFLVYYQENIESPQEGSFTAPVAGTYYLVAKNWSSSLPETVAWSRSMTRADNVLDYLQIIYRYLQDEGINYINVPGNFFETLSQQVLLPDEVISLGGGNCIDGSLLFASLLEQMGVRPVVVVRNGPPSGHAWVGVWSAPTGGTLWPIETTSMGSGEPWEAALQTAVGNSSTATDLVDISDARLLGLLPMPL